MKKRFIMSLLITLFLMSCGKTTRLSRADYGWMPYKGDETLVFKSINGNTDTIFLIRKDTLWGLPDPALSLSKYEISAIFCKSLLTNLHDKRKDYSQYYFLKIRKTMTEQTELVIDLSTKGAQFYNLTPIKTDSLSAIKPIFLKSNFKTYDDVYIILPDNYANDFYHRKDFVTKLYWSKSIGLVRYDKKDGEYWELVRHTKL